MCCHSHALTTMRCHSHALPTMRCHSHAKTTMRCHSHAKTTMCTRMVVRWHGGPQLAAVLQPLHCTSFSIYHSNQAKPATQAHHSKLHSKLQVDFASSSVGHEVQPSAGGGWTEYVCGRSVVLSETDLLHAKAVAILKLDGRMRLHIMRCTMTDDERALLADTCQEVVRHCEWNPAEKRLLVRHSHAVLTLPYAASNELALKTSAAVTNPDHLQRLVVPASRPTASWFSDGTQSVLACHSDDLKKIVRRSHTVSQPGLSQLRFCATL